MSVTVNVNKLSLCHKGSNGITTATIPDVCKTPSPGGPIPIPYPNIAFSRDLVKGTTTIKADGGNMTAKYGSEFFKSTGDEPGTLGGVVSSSFIKEASWITYSFNVKLEGKGACRLTDKMFHNKRNTVNMAGELQMYVPTNPILNLQCNVFCQTLEARKKVKSAQDKLKKNPNDKNAKKVLDKHKDYMSKDGKKFLNSKYAKDLSRGDLPSSLRKKGMGQVFKKEFAKNGLKSEKQILTRISQKTQNALRNTSRKIYSSADDFVKATGKKAVAQVDRLGGALVKGLNKAKRELAEKLAKKVGKKLATKAATFWARAIPVAGWALAAYDVYDTAKTAYDVSKALSNFAKDYMAKNGVGGFVQATPDVAKYGPNGELEEIFDYKFENDTFQKGQDLSLIHI